LLTQAEKGTRFRQLHERGSAFIIPNPWSPGTAHVLAQLGFEALATTSAGFAFSVGKRDNAVGRDEMLAHACQMSAATDLPVSADLENGYVDDPAGVAETIRRAAAAGLAGCSIEDSTGRRDRPLYEATLAADRIRAAAEAAHALPFCFTLTARAENFLVGQGDIKEVIRRLQAYQDAGADVLHAPGIASREDIRAVVTSVDRPVNVLAGVPGLTLGLAELSELGVRRVSVGSALFRAAFDGFVRAAREMAQQGTFEFAGKSISFREATALFPK
jgi:2-methylisocitrate lyase-like PEP mutase family enzyme